MIFNNEQEMLEKVDVVKLFKEKYSDYPFNDFWADEVVAQFEDILAFFGFFPVEVTWGIPGTEREGAAIFGEWSDYMMQGDMLKSYYPEEPKIIEMFGEFKNFVETNSIKDAYIETYNGYKMSCRIYNNGKEICDSKLKDEFCRYCEKLVDWFIVKLKQEFDEITTPERLAHKFIINEVEVSEEYLKKFV